MRSVELADAIEQTLDRLTRELIFCYQWNAADGLNARRINQLAKKVSLGPIFDVKERKGVFPAVLLINHPRGERPVRFEKLSQKEHPWTWQDDYSDLKRDRAIENLEAWLELAEEPDYRPVG